MTLSKSMQESILTALDRSVLTRSSFTYSFEEDGKVVAEILSRFEPEFFFELTKVSDTKCGLREAPGITWSSCETSTIEVNQLINRLQLWAGRVAKELEIPPGWLEQFEQSFTQSWEAWTSGLPKDEPFDQEQLSDLQVKVERLQQVVEKLQERVNRQDEFQERAVSEIERLKAEVERHARKARRMSKWHASFLFLTSFLRAVRAIVTAAEDANGGWTRELNEAVTLVLPPVSTESEDSMREAAE